MNRSHLFLSTLFFILGSGIFVGREISIRRADLKLAAPNSRQPGSTVPSLNEELTEALAWNRYALKRNGENYSMRFFMEKTLSCDPGEYEAIVGSLKRTAGKNLLLSLESISVEDGLTPITMEIGKAEFANGFSRTLDIPGNLGPRQLGLFLCTDSQNAGRCAVKPVVQIHEVLRENSKQEKEAQPTEAPDRIYYFQYVFLDGDGAMHLFRQSPIAKRSLDMLSGRFPSFFTPESVELERMHLAKAGLFSRTLASAPLSLKSDGFAVTLPSRDTSRCSSVIATEEKRK